MIYRGHRNVRSVVAEVRDWEHPEPSQSVIVDERAGKVERIRWELGGPWPKPTEVIRRIWFEPTDRLRVEIIHGGRVTRLAIRQGSRWWRWDQDEGENAGDQSLDASVLPPILQPTMLSPELLLPKLWFEPAGCARRAGREVLLARASPREPAEEAEPVSYEVEFDARHGTILARTLLQSGRRAAVTETLAITYDDEIDASRFDFAKPRPPLGRTLPARRAGRPPENPAGSVVRRMALAGRTVIGTTLWLTGLPCAGKTTLANTVERTLLQLGHPCCLLGGEALRDGLSQGLGLSRADRAEEARRAAHVAALLANAGFTAVVDIECPYAADRDQVRMVHQALGAPFLEIFVDTPLDLCIERSAARLAAGMISPEQGAASTYESVYQLPSIPELTVNGCNPQRQVAAQIIDALLAGHRQPR